MMRRKKQLLGLAVLTALVLTAGGPTLPVLAAEKTDDVPTAWAAEKTEPVHISAVEGEDLEPVHISAVEGGDLEPVQISAAEGGDLEPVQIPSKAAENTVTVQIPMQAGQTEGRKVYGMINAFRTGQDAWYWNEDDATKTSLVGKLQPLQYDYGLEKVATQRAAELALLFAHERPDGTSCFTAYPDMNVLPGENIAYAEPVGWYNAETVNAAWREDKEPYDGQGHRRNMLGTNYNYVGVGHVIFDNKDLWVEEFSSDPISTQPTAAMDSTVYFTINSYPKYVNERFDQYVVTPIDPDKFRDVQDPSAYYYEPVYWAKEAGITVGTDATWQLFGVGEGCTRGQMAAFLYTMAGKPEPADGSDFLDVPAGVFYEKAVAWARENGITSGTTSTTFSPDRTCSRAEMVTFLYHFAKIEGKDLGIGADVSFQDVPAGKFYSGPVVWAAALGITEGTGDGNFSPMASCTREQMVTFLYKYSML